MRSRKYWQDRVTALEYYIQQDATKARDEIMRLLGEALDKIDRETSKIRRELGKVTGKVTEEELDELLGFSERDKSYQELLKIMHDTDDETAKAMLLERINAQAYGARIKRVDAIGNKILGEFMQMANKEQVLCKELFSSVFTESYYTNIYNLAEGYNAGVSFDVLPKRAIQAALQEDWNGANYSSRIWNHSKEFAEQVEKTVVSGLMSGKSTPKMAMELSGFAKDDAYYVKERLIRSETAHFLSQGQKEAYEVGGIEQYRFLASLSERTCEVCGDLDNKTFYVDEATEGENFPPMHPNCRCVTVTADVKLKNRTAKDPVTGENYKVEGDMSFAQWKESLSDEQKQAFDLHVRQMRNKSADKKQYDRYIERLGAENMPKTFDKFQEMKYTDIEKWNLIKLDYQRQERLIRHSELALPNGKSATADDRKFTGYLFNPQNTDGWAKGKAFTSRLGYDISNYGELKQDIIAKAIKYPATYKVSDQFGDKYEQKMVLYGIKDRPANVIVGWKVKGDNTWLTSAYIKEV